MLSPSFQKGDLNLKSKSIILLILFTILIILCDISFAADMGKVDAAGNRILNTVRGIGYWAILIKGIADVIGQGMRGELHSIGKTIMLYVILYGTLFFFPYALRLVEGVF